MPIGSLTRPAVRLRRVPPLDPPFDDEAAPTVWSDGAVGQLALTLPDPVALSAPPVEPRPSVEAPARRPAGLPAPATRRGTAPSRPTPAEPAPPAGLAASGVAQRLTTGGGLPAAGLAGASPEARQAARRFLGVCLEILNDYRPVAQVRCLANPTDAAEVVKELSAAASRLAAPRRDHRRPVTENVRLRRVRVCEPLPGVAETAAVITRTGRTWALAFRMERRRDTWLCTTACLI